MATRLILEQSSEETASLASKAMRGERLTQDEVKKLAGSVMRHRRMDVIDGGSLLGVEISFPEDSGSSRLLLRLREDETIAMYIDSDEFAELARWYLDQYQR